AAVAAEQKEVEDLFAQFAPRSKVRDAISALLAVREFSFVSVGHRSLIEITPPRAPIPPRRPPEPKPPDALATARPVNRIGGPLKPAVGVSARGATAPPNRTTAFRGVRTGGPLKPGSGLRRGGRAAPINTS